MPTDPNVDNYITSVLTAYNAAKNAPTTSTDSAGNVTTVPYSGPPSFVASDGKTFTDADSYRSYQTGLDTTRHQELLTQAESNAQTQAQQQVAARGLNYGDYSGQIQDYINKIVGTIPQYDTNPASYFDPNLADTVLGDIQATARHGDIGAVNSTFGPNYDTTALPNDYLNSTISDILGTQKQTAQDALTRGLARGQFNQIGYDAAEKNLGTQYSGANASLASTANDVLNSYRTKLDDVRNSAFNTASNYQLGDNFNIGDYTKQAGDVLGQAKSYAPGDFINQIGKAPLFDIPSLVTAGGTAQGSQNLANPDVADALAQRRKDNQVGAGVGSQGAF